MQKDKIVIDVNVFLARLFFNSQITKEVLDKVKEDLFILLSCKELSEELDTKIDYFLKKLSQAKFKEIRFWSLFVKNTAKYIKLKSTLKICRDPKDDYLVNLAIDGLANYLITRDKDLLEIAEERIRNLVIKPEEFMGVVRSKQKAI